MKSIRLAALIVAGLVLIGLISVARATASEKNTSNGRTQSPKNQAQNENDPQQNTAPALSAILLVNSKACQCTRDRCQAAETIMQKIQEGYKSELAYQTLDWELQQEKASSMVKQYKVFLIPTLIVLDKNKRVVWRCEDFSKEEPIQVKLKELVKKTSSAGGSEH